DDGLQHYALERDVEIAMIDAARGFGNGLPLPAGPLREPRARLERVDAVVVNGDAPTHGISGPAPAFTMTLCGARFRNVRDCARTADVSEFAGRRLVAIAGIGNPARFFTHLRALGLAFEAHAFSDHHRYAAHEVRFPDADAILMTEKDAIKCASFSDARMWALPVNAVTSDALATLVLERIGHRRLAAQAPR